MSDWELAEVYGEEEAEGIQPGERVCSMCHDVFYIQPDDKTAHQCIHCRPYAKAYPHTWWHNLQSLIAEPRYAIPYPIRSDDEICRAWAAATLVQDWEYTGLPVLHRC